MVDTAGGREAGTIDFDLGGYVGVRLVGAGPRERTRVTAQLGPIEAALDREPDVTVRFVDRIRHGPLTHVALGETAFDEASFLVLSGAGRVRAKARIPFEDLGSRALILCERALPAVPHLVAMVNLAALGKGVLPLHASAFVHEGRGLLVTGWAKGGKTEALLAFMRRGARYVGDEWVYVTPDGRMFGIPEPIRLWRWQLAQHPHLAARTSSADRLRMAALDGLAGTLERVAPARGGGFPGAALRRAAPVVRRQVNTRVPPARLFGPDRIHGPATVDSIVLVSSHDRADVLVEEVDPGEVARRMTASLEHERHALLGAYRQFRFAFPDRRSEAIERAGEVEAGLIARAFDGRPVAWLRHPYPPDIDALYPPIAELLARGSRQSRLVA